MMIINWWYMERVNLSKKWPKPKGKNILTSFLQLISEASFPTKCRLLKSTRRDLIKMLHESKLNSLYHQRTCANRNKHRPWRMGTIISVMIWSIPLPFPAFLLHGLQQQDHSSVQNISLSLDHVDLLWLSDQLYAGNPQLKKQIPPGKMTTK